MAEVRVSCAATPEVVLDIFEMPKSSTLSSGLLPLRRAKK